MDKDVLDNYIEDLRKMINPALEKQIKDLNEKKRNVEESKNLLSTKDFSLYRDLAIDFPIDISIDDDKLLNVKLSNVLKLIDADNETINTNSLLGFFDEAYKSNIYKQLENTTNSHNEKINLGTTETEFTELNSAIDALKNAAEAAEAEKAAAKANLTEAQKAAAAKAAEAAADPAKAAEAAADPTKAAEAEKANLTEAQKAAAEKAAEAEKAAAKAAEAEKAAAKAAEALNHNKSLKNIKEELQEINAAAIINEINTIINALSKYLKNLHNNIDTFRQDLYKNNSENKDKWITFDTGIENLHLNKDNEDLTKIKSNELVNVLVNTHNDIDIKIKKLEQDLKKDKPTIASILSYFNQMPEVLKNSHKIYLQSKSTDEMLKRIKKFNELSYLVESSLIPDEKKAFYLKLIKWYSTSQDDSVFKTVEQLTSKVKRPTKFFGKRYNVNIIVKLQERLKNYYDKQLPKKFDSITENNTIALKAVIETDDKPSGKDGKKGAAPGGSPAAQPAAAQGAPPAAKAAQGAPPAAAATAQGAAPPAAATAQGGSRGGSQESNLGDINSSESKDDENSDEKKAGIENKIKFAKFKEFYKYRECMIKGFYEFNKRFYLNRVRKQLKYIKIIKSWIENDLKLDNGELFKFYEKYLKDIEDCENSLSDIGQRVSEYISEFDKQLKQGNEYIAENMKSLKKSEQNKLTKLKGKQEDAAMDRLIKLNRIYNNRNQMPLMIDNQYIYMYMLKVTTYGLQYLALFFAEKVFSDMYSKKVFIKNEEPPNILVFYGIFLGFSFAGIIFTVVVLFILDMLFNKPTTTYYGIDKELISKYIFDMLFYLLFSGAVICVSGSIIQRKKYFKYKTEGPRAIRAYSEIISMLNAILIIVPYFSYTEGITIKI